MKMKELCKNTSNACCTLMHWCRGTGCRCKITVVRAVQVESITCMQCVSSLLKFRKDEMKMAIVPNFTSYYV
jgi:hypothetical protein